ncbi:hypothetical protein [Antribacter gilvus]|uniref:hypothetical protein n=1 Tax=Antribacter gilvus TaxID=2304675 RepID=UPI0013E0B38B|nr:hypothetical protein [Antribacter gilvus]
MSRRIGSLVGAATAASLVATAFVATPAVADEDDVFAEQVAAWAVGIGASEVLTQPLPVVGVAPGALLAGADPTLGGDLTRDGNRFTLAVTEAVPTYLTLAPGFPLSSQPGSITTDVTVSVAFTVATADVDGSPYRHVVASGPDAPAITASVALDGLPGPLAASVGLLGVDLTEAAPVTLTAQYAGSLGDPDGDGRLAFDDPGGLPTDGELSAAGSATGLASVGLASAAAGGTLAVTSSGSVLAEPVSAQVAFSWTDLTDPATLTVTPTGFGAVQDFLTMSVRDTAEGLVLVKSALAAFQRAQLPGSGNLDLPFMRGTLADALALNERIVAFLEDNLDPVEAGVVDPNDGQPEWTSVQELFTLLEAAEGIDVQVGAYDAGTKRLPYTVSLARSATGEDLADAPAPAPDTGLENDAKPGLVELGDVLTDGTGRSVGDVVGAQATATVSPDYSAQIELALDLSAPVEHDPPLAVEGPDGTVTHYDITPIGVDRTLVRGVTATADFPVSTAVAAAGSVGFVGVDVGGQIEVGRQDDAQPMLSLTAGSATYRSVSDVFEELRADADALLDVDLNIAASVANGTIAVTGMPGFLPSEATWSVPPCAIEVVPAGCSPQLGGLADLLALDVDVNEPRALLGRLADVLALLDAGLRSPSIMGDAAHASLPLTGTSVAEILAGDGGGLATSTKLTQAVDALVTNPPTTLQETVDALEAALETDLPVRLTEIEGEPSVVLDVDFERAYDRSKTLAFDLDGIPLVGASSNGQVNVHAAVDVETGVAVPLGSAAWTTGADAIRLVDPDITASAQATLEGSLAVSLAGLTAQLGTGTDPVTGAVGLTAAFSQTGAVALGDLLGGDLAVAGTDACTGGAVLCADLPVYVLGQPLSNTSNSLVLSLPSPGTLTGDWSGLDVTLPDTDALAQLLYSTPFDMNNLPSGILTYLTMVEQGLQAASLGGKVPLLGDQLVEAANVVAEAKAALQGLGDLSGQAYADAKAAIEGALGATLSEQCGVLQATTGVTAQAVVDAPSGDPLVNYRYVVVARAGTTPTQYSAESNAVDNEATLSADNRNEVTWVADGRASGYLVLRSVDGGAWEQVADVAAGTTTFSDDGTATPVAAPADPGAPVQVTGCGATNPLAIEAIVVDWDFDPNGPGGEPELCQVVPLDLGIPGLALRASTVQGAQDPAACADSPGGGLRASLDYGFGIEIALDKTAGVVVLTGNEGATEDDPGRPEAFVGAAVSLDPVAGGDDLTAELAILQVGVEKNDPAKEELSGSFSVDLVGEQIDVAGAPVEGVRLDKLVSAPGDVVHVGAEFEVDIDWNLVAAPLVNGQTLPGIATDFELTWSADAGAGASPTFGDPNPDVSTSPSIAFRNISLDLGSFLEEQIKPAVDEVNRVLDPLRPIIETLSAPIPVLTDLSTMAGGDPVTLLSIAKAYNTLTGGTDTQMIDTVVGVVQTVAKVDQAIQAVASGDGIPLPIGDLEVDGAVAKTTAATPDQVETLKSGFTAAAVPGGSTAATVQGLLGPDSVSETTPKGRFGFTFTLLEQPEQLANLLLNGDVEIVRFDTGTLELGFSFEQSFGPVYAPPPIFITLSGAAGVKARLILGFDTFGFRQAIEAARAGGGASSALHIFEGLYLATTDLEGRSIPVLEFYGEIAAGLSLNIVIIRVDVRGGFGLTVAFYWNDPNDDGKFRFSEFGDQAKISPICLFRTEGKLYLFLELGVTIGISIFSVSFDVTIAKVTILDFSAEPDCEPEPPKLGEVTGDVLVVYLGKAGGLRGGSWAPSGDKPEVFKVYERHDHHAGTEGDRPVTGYAVEGLGIVREFEGPVSTVVVDGGDTGTPFHLTFFGDSDRDDPDLRAGFRTPVVVVGSSGPDEIKTDEGPAYVDAREGDDVVTTSNAPGNPARVAGGPGKDRVTTGQGDSVAAGDSTLPVESTTPVGGQNVATALGSPSAGTTTGDDEDAVAVGTGTNTAFGNGGRDRLGVVGEQGNQRTPRPNILVGGDGPDLLTGGPGHDVLYPGTAPGGGLLELGGATYTPGGGLTEPQRAALADASGTPDDVGVDGFNTVDTGSGSDVVIGSDKVDLVQSSSLGSQETSSYLFGGSGEDVLAGGFGGDEVFGGPDDDYVLAEPTDVGAPSNPGDGYGPVRSLARHTLPAGESAAHDLLVGGAGNDHLLGGDGGADAWGDAYRPAELCVAGDPVASDGDTPGADAVPIAPDTGADDGQDTITGGRGVDVVRAGGGNDRATLAEADDRGCGQGGNDVVGGGDGADDLWGGSDVDTLYGDAGTDEVYGNAGADVVYAGDHVDVAEGNDGADSLFGGAEADLLVGGTRAEGRPDTGDALYGDAGTDTLIGDNGAADAGAPLGYRPFDLAGPATAGGDDQLYGAAGADLGFGGIGSDLLVGADGADHLEGGPNPLGTPDVVLGQNGDDELVGGSFLSAPDADDVVEGGEGADVQLGDNGSVVPTAVDPAGTPVLVGRETAAHTVVELDTEAEPPAGTSGPDVLRGGPADDALLAQGGDDPEVAGGDGDDLAVGGRGSDTVTGDAGRDDLVGGSVTPLGTTVPGGPGTDGQPDQGDVVRGGTEGDIALGDNAVVTVAAGTPPSVTPLLAGRERASQAPRVLRLLDLGGDAGPVEGPGADAGGDLLQGEADEDVLLGQAGADRVQGGDADDAAEGGPGTDWIEGGPGDDDLVGGSTTPAAAPASSEPGTGSTASTGQPDAGDYVFGGTGDDASLGDDGVILRGQGAGTSVLERSSTDGTLVRQRDVVLYDLGAPLGGGDYLLGGDGVDVQWGQDGRDAITGGPHDDYAEGDGAGDVIYGDLPVLTLTEAGEPASGVVEVPLPVATWPGAAALEPETGPHGQDDLIGGASLAGFRDAGDRIAGDGESDVALGDDGTLLRDPVEAGGLWSDRVEPDRYPVDVADPAYPARLFAVRLHDPAKVPAGQDGTTRFCAEVPDRTTCEPAGAWGGDTVDGGDGDDRLWGQDGNDTMAGGAGNDDLTGELGDDTLSGEGGQDTILGDRGGVVGQWIDTAAEGTFTTSVSGTPQESYTGLRPGTLDRRVDLLSDVEDRAWVDTDAQPMPYPGLRVGGNDRIRGGDDHDVVFGGAGADLANGDSGGDFLFGGNGSDVVWGGRGLADGSPARGAQDEHLDLVFGGSSVAGTGTDSVLGADILDWNPRGSADTPGTTCAVSGAPAEVPGTVVDPCVWFAMTDTDDADPGNDQHHHGTDWIYGGWDRDVMQGNETANGPSDQDDRLIDWNGAFNLYSHCNAAYGGWNDIRQHSPSMKSFLRAVAYAAGAGRDADDVTTPGSSAFVEVAVVEPSDNNGHGTGKAFPTTPGHFDDPAACAVP